MLLLPESGYLQVLNDGLWFDDSVRDCYNFAVMFSTMRFTPWRGWDFFPS
jgi:hypothetical protein